MALTPLDDLNRLYGKLKRRAGAAEVWSNYYNGNVPLKFASPEFRGQTGALFDDFSDNWCQVVPDATVERMVPIAFRLNDGTMDDKAWDAWRRNEADVEVGLAFLEALIAGRSFGLVWKPDGVNTEITFHDVRQAIVDYVPGKRRVRRAGLLVWRDGNQERASLFYPDAVFLFVRKTDTAFGYALDSGAGWVSAGTLANPLGVVPLVALENRARLRGNPTSEIASVAPLQDSVNTLWAHLMTAADERAVPARAVLGMDRPTKEILDQDGEVIGEEDLPIDRFRRDRLLWLEREGASIAEFSAADLTNYTSVIETAVRHIAAQTRTPPSYLTGEMVNISADALVASEAGLVAKVQERQRYFGASLRELMRLEALASGDPARAEALSMGSVVWRDAQFRSEAQYADALTKYKAINVPDEALWERMPDTTPEEIERWKSMRDDQAVAITGGSIAALYGPKPDVPAADDGGIVPAE
ncbi:phage portal protein [Streptomyces sp. NBC_01500]|uniref:phage portal protein n=1 Tax=Streptomyces sp. NBC_01500 TaxID=2903886 RepID=UPI0022519C8C|nr:phage portal protein [Streptomyces sp. NBC_01500]MCX4547286.1 phage portal protein [Streptomyces sp. NBC_01500]MCX4554206.1 phage portal protein [Streptomyces sp. NBC_01500]MCX4554546.1 phage portal protein [Streptomyces sp. NBC_01500]